MLLRVALLAAALCAVPVACVEKHKFKACKDSSFCLRHRALPTHPTSYTVEGLTANPTAGLVTGTLRDAQYPDVALMLYVATYADGVARVLVQEHEPKVFRFDAAAHVLLDTVATVPLTEAAPGRYSFNDGRSVVEIDAAPLRIRLVRDGAVAVEINSRNLLYFEHTREHGDGSDPRPLALHGEGLWDETFGGHKDPKALGPQSVGMDFVFPGSQHVYGIPEHATSFSLPSTREGETVHSDPYRLFNLDVFEYELNSPMALYGAVPLLISHTEALTAGVFWLNPSETWIDIGNAAAGKESHWFSETGNIDVFLLSGAAPQSVVSQYARLTGAAAMPQRFSLGHHVCRWNYKDEKDVAMVDAQMDEADIPFDVLWLDIEHTDGKRYFTWDKRLFPDPAGMQRALAAKERKMVTIIDPHIKRDNAYYVHKTATDNGLYVKAASGKDFEGHCWPGASSYLDFLDVRVRQQWAAWLGFDSYEGATPSLYTWIDMNEPSVFSGPETSMDRDARHHGGWEHRDVHNMYGYFQGNATFEGQLARHADRNDRPFVLSRSFFAGSQRVTAIWTGDNAAQWDHLAATTPMLLSHSIAGIVFIGADVGGFFGNPDVELLTRWYEVGAFHPFFRAHAHLETKRREPYLFPEPYVSHMRAAIRSRYRILPYLYTLFHEAAQDLTPVMRPIWYEFPGDPVGMHNDAEFLLGPALLVHPVVEAGATTVEVMLPGQLEWIHYSTRESFAPGRAVVPAPLGQPAVFQRVGTIIPRQDRPRRSSALMEKDPYTLVIALGPAQEASGSLYLDDGHSYDFEKGAFVKRAFAFAGGKLSATDAGSGSGPFVATAQVERIVVTGVAAEPQRVVLEGPQRTLSFTYDPLVREVVVKKPGVGIGEDWVVAFE